MVENEKIPSSKDFKKQSGVQKYMDNNNEGD